jgi:hypothetical protein
MSHDLIFLEQESNYVVFGEHYHENNVAAPEKRYNRIIVAEKTNRASFTTIETFRESDRKRLEKSIL